MHRPLLAVATSILLSACAASPRPATTTTRDPAALDSVTSSIMGIPVSTKSADARDHFLQGQRELDLARNFEALDHFKRAVAADSTFAIAYLNVANTGNSFEEFKTNLARAEALAAGASDAEQLQIEIARKGFENDVSGQLAAAQQLVAKYPESPRAYLTLGNIQTGLNNNADARASYEKALSLAPRFAVAHIAMGTSYLFGEPRDFNQALQHYQAAAARADYDSAMAVGRGNERGFFAPFRAYVSAYAGDAKGAITELNQLVAQADGMGIPDPVTVKINALSNVALIAIDTRDFPSADAALRQRTPLMMQQADKGGSAGFRRAQQQNVAYFNAWLAARKSDYRTAQRETARLTALVTPDANPRKMEPVHQLMGFVALYQGHNAEAAAHFAQGNLLDPYIKYNYAMALDGSAQGDKAKPIFRELAIYNFNSLGYALIRKEAQQMAQ